MDRACKGRFLPRRLLRPVPGNTCTMTTDTTLAAALVEAWRGGRPLTADTATRLAPADEAGAYAVQREIAATLGWFAEGRPHAWKMGASTRTAAPTAAPIADRALRTAPVELGPRDRHTLVGVEVELAVRLARPLAPGCSAAEARAAVGEVLAAIEICDVRAEAWPTLPPLFRLADQQMNGWLILGSGVADGWSDGYAAGEVVMTVNGAEQLRARAAHPLGDPLYLLPWLAGHAAGQYAGGLQAGDIVTTGTWTGLYAARPGDRIHAAFEGIGEVALSISAE